MHLTHVCKVSCSILTCYDLTSCARVVAYTVCEKFVAVPFVFVNVALFNIEVRISMGGVVSPWPCPPWIFIHGTNIVNGAKKCYFSVFFCYPHKKDYYFFFRFFFLCPPPPPGNLLLDAQMFWCIICYGCLVVQRPYVLIPTVCHILLAYCFTCVNMCVSLQTYQLRVGYNQKEL